MMLAVLAIDKSLIMPVWTISIELVGSAMMPLIVMIAFVKRCLFDWILIGAGLAAYSVAHAPHRLSSLSYLFDFMLGAWVASRRPTFLAGEPLPKVLAAACTLVFFRFVWFGLRNGHVTPLYLGYDDPLPMLVEGISAAFLVGILASEHGRIRLLRSSIAVSLGDVSYGLYLVHFPVAILIAKLLSRVFSDGTSSTTAQSVLMTIGLAISLGLAFLIHRFIEVPSIAFGKRLSRQLGLTRSAVRF